MATTITWNRPSTQTTTKVYPGRPQVMCVRAPCNVNVQRPTYERPTYVERPAYAPQRPVYERPAQNTGSVYGGSTSSSRPAQTTGSWNTSGGYGGR
jgi:hypothetical protein